jgi:3-hydroxypropanoate dehydrogenase
MRLVLGDDALSTLFTNARSQRGWLTEPVDNEDLKAAYNVAKWGPTSMNTQPMRLLLLRSQEAKARLVPALAPANVEKVLTAPVVAVIAYDLEFFTQLPKTFPHNPDAQSYFHSNQAVVEPTAFRNSSLQAAYFMLALRAAGLDVGPMSGFDAAKIDTEFFSRTPWRVNLICGIGHGDPSKLSERLPRLDFDEVAQTL